MKLCSVEGCEQKHYGRGYCSLHLQRVRKYGDPLATKFGRTARPVSMRGLPAAERFAARISRGEQCWLWTGSTDSSGYGTFYVDGKTVSAHRHAWESERGEIPPGGEVMHSCDTPACVRIEHLSIGTHVLNMQDMKQKGRKKRSHCEAGHPLTDETRNAVGNCRECHNRYARERASRLYVPVAKRSTASEDRPRD